MRVLFAPLGLEEYRGWRAADPAIASRIDDLVRDIRSSPFSGIGKPEPLRGDLRGWWSRRITLEHRLVYRVRGTGDEQTLEIASCRFHYSR